MRYRVRPSPPIPVNIEIGEKIYSGSYYVERGTMTVCYAARRKTMRNLGWHRDQMLARIMLLQLVEAELSGLR